MCRTFIDLQTGNDGLVQAGVYDLAGRRMRSLFDGTLSAGSHHILWDGRDESGGAVPAGIYLVRIATAEGNRTAHLIMVR